MHDKCTELSVTVSAGVAQSVCKTLTTHQDSRIISLRTSRLRWGPCMFERLSAEPIYNTRAVVRRTGVPADTFRAWERRYGVPSPLRTAGNQRLYSERDIRIITWLREQTAVGLTISQAIHLMRSSKNPAPTAPLPAAPPVEPDIEEVLAGKRSDSHDPLITQRRRIIDAFSRLDGQAAEHILQETYAWAELEVVLADLLMARSRRLFERRNISRRTPRSRTLRARSFSASSPRSITSRIPTTAVARSWQPRWLANRAI